MIGDDRPGDTTQSIGMAQALGWPFVFKEMRFNRWARPRRLLLSLFGRVGTSLHGVDRLASDALEPPWPDLAIGSVWRTAPVVRWIAAQSGGTTRTIQLGRKGAEFADAFDVVVSPGYWRLLPHPRRIETLVPMHRVTGTVLAEAARHWQGLFGDAPKPHVALLVGGSTGGGFYRLDAEAARIMGERVRAFAESSGGTVFAIGSRRTGEAPGQALAEALPPPHRFTPWDPDRENPYLGHLALGDVLVVTGESESMLAEAAATGKPVYIYPLPQRAPGLAEFLLDNIALRARDHILDEQGRGVASRTLGAFCAWLIGRGVIRPPRDLGVLHRALIARGVGQPFGAPMRLDSPKFEEAAEVARRVRQMLLLPEPPELGRASLAPNPSDPGEHVVTVR